MPSRLIVVLVSLMLAMAIVMFWLLLVIEPVVPCPEECSCRRGGRSIRCDGPSLTAVPLFRLTYLKVVRLFKNNITSIERGSFVLLTELEKLIMCEVGLRTIEVGAFNGLKMLTELIINGNNLSEILPGTFENLFNLISVHLNGNSLEYLDSGVFSGLVNIKYIYLIGNQLQHIHQDTFFGLPYLKRIILRSNPGLHIPTDRNFIKSHSLSQLDISACNVSSVSVETFANVSALKWLDLSDSNLWTVDINILTALQNLSTLHLYGNPLQCDCQLQEVWRWCEDRNIRTMYGELAPECDTPSEVEGMWWGGFEEGQCFDGIIHYYGDYRNKSYIYDDTYETYYDTETDTYNNRESDTYSNTKTDTYEYNDYYDTFNSELIAEYQVQLFVVPVIFGITSNIIILIIIIFNKDMRTVPNMYIINLAISDIIYLTVLFSEACVNRKSYTWVYGFFMCTFLPFCRRLSVGLSAYSIAVISVQRYRVTVNPLHVLVSSQPTWRATVITICGVWIVAALFAVPSALSKYPCEEFMYFGRTIYYRRVVKFELLTSCVLPLCVIAFCYIMTARHLVENSRLLFEATQNPQLETRRNTAKIVVGLTVVFLISYVPYHVFWTYFICTAHFSSYLTNFTDVIDKSNYKLQYTYLISTCFLLINSCLNPVALFCTSSPFREHLKRYLTCFCKQIPLPLNWN